MNVLPERLFTDSSALTRRLAREYEIPNCGCDPDFVLACERRHGPGGCHPTCKTPDAPFGCDDRMESGQCECTRVKDLVCDCSLVPGPPCEHILAALCPMSLLQWAAMLAREDARYRDRPTPAGAMMALTREARVELMAKRETAKQHLYHPLDVRRDFAPGIGQMVRRGRNGREIEGGHQVLRGKTGRTVFPLGTD